MRIGSGYDAHRLVEGRDLVLGGVKIQSAIPAFVNADPEARFLLEKYRQYCRRSFHK